MCLSGRGVQGGAALNDQGTCGHWCSASSVKFPAGGLPQLRNVRPVRVAVRRLSGRGRADALDCRLSPRATSERRFRDREDTVLPQVWAAAPTFCRTVPWRVRVHRHDIGATWCTSPPAVSPVTSSAAAEVVMLVDAPSFESTLTAWRRRSTGMLEESGDSGKLSMWVRPVRAGEKVSVSPRWCSVALGLLRRVGCESWSLPTSWTARRKDLRGGRRWRQQLAGLVAVCRRNVHARVSVNDRSTLLDSAAVSIRLKGTVTSLTVNGAPYATTNVTDSDWSSIALSVTNEPLRSIMGIVGGRPRSGPQRVRFEKRQLRPESAGGTAARLRRREVLLRVTPSSDTEVFLAFARDPDLTAALEQSRRDALRGPDGQGLKAGTAGGSSAASSSKHGCSAAAGEAVTLPMVAFDDFEGTGIMTRPTVRVCAPAAVRPSSRQRDAHS